MHIQSGYIPNEPILSRCRTEAMHTISQTIHTTVLGVVMLCLYGCGDAPLYETPLPNGYAHWSNGGELGTIVLPSSNDTATVVAPYGVGPNSGRLWCNDFAVSGQFVVGEVIEPACRAYVDPPLSRRYLIFDTQTGEVTYFDTREEVDAAWQETTGEPLPELKRRHANRRQLM